MGRSIGVLLLTALLSCALTTATALADTSVLDFEITALVEKPPKPMLFDQAWDKTARDHVIALVNSERAIRGLANLRESPTLDAAAQSYTQVLVDDTCFGHSCGPEPDFTTRDTKAGYGPWAWLGENVAAGQPTPEAVVEAWMASSLHRDNILRPEFTEIGVAIAHGGLHGTYWAQEFGARPI